MKISRSIAIVLVLLLIGCSAGQGNRDNESTLPLVQTGSVQMPHTERPTGDPWELVYQKRVQFPERYRDVPSVQFFVQSIEAYTRRQGTFYQLKAVDLNAEGFDLQIYGAYMNSFSNCNVGWIAIGHR